MILLLSLIFFVFGLIIGSFLNVVIYRFNTKKSLGGRSACMSCQNTLSWYELIPLFSFLALGGRCKNCKTKISIQYPLVELATGLIFAGLFLKFSSFLFLTPIIFAAIFTYNAFMFSLLIIIAAYDIKHKIIPDSLVWIFCFGSIVGLILFLTPSKFTNVWDLLAGPMLAFPFALLWLVSGGRWMGLGDAKLVLGLGWMLGLEQGFTALVLAFWFGAIIGVILVLVSKNYKMKSEIPFAPYLILGALLVFFLKLNFFGF